ncbi:hypothetical protein KC19_2G264000 [Ceratodon purpureus]|uniref:Uncharacterized protein n=1 Tax=Ceratodon purpureus TaxID=3225 RepID=A0A8T0IZP7_CERPU|nr:hypothetical protein KC19_2G264000 [Ceratodon purpureus]KAG0588717.1 hypothetical protein KC19_2G264000 [Ceratodon purpureus]KAG0588719.1 hypothetical protein KC19_2G264000 [Ceratodon purpureus]
MAHGHHDENLEILQNQGSFRIEKPGYFRVNDLKYSARLVLSSCVIASLQIGTYFGSLMAGRLALGDEIAEPLVFIFASLILLGAHDGMKGNLVKSARLPGRHAILFLIGSLDLIFTGARAELQSSNAGIQNGSEVHDNAFLKAVAVFILAVVTTIGVAVGGSWMVKLLSPFGKTPTAVPAVQAIQAIPADDQALPVIPVVQGDDMDDVLARAPVATRLNSPLSWL